MYSDGGITSMLDTLIPLTVLILFMFLLLYLLHAVGLYKMGKTVGAERSWLAFVPVANLYVMGKIVKEVSIAGITLTKLEFVLPAVTVTGIVLSQLPAIGFLAGAAAGVFYYIVLYNLYKNFRPASAAPFIIVSILLGFMTSIFVFIMRNDIPVEQHVKMQI